MVGEGVPEKRELLLSAPRKLKDRNLVGGLFVGKLINRDLCEYHEACAALCPIGAMQSGGKGTIFY